MNFIRTDIQDPQFVKLLIFSNFATISYNFTLGRDYEKNTLRHRRL